MQLKYKETLGRGRGEVGAGVLTSGACGEGGAGGVEVGVGARARDEWRRRGWGRGRRRGCAESARWPTGDNGGKSGELDLGEVAVGKDEPRG